MIHLKTICKNIDGDKEYSDLFWGTADEIYRLYDKIARAWEKDKTNLSPRFLRRPKVNPYRTYAIDFYPDGSFEIITSDTVCHSFMDPDIEIRVVKNKRKLP